ncbi:similar to Saccharomyces cerevisiae YAR007C RFA1 Subunit of heterotrimeric Replication Protein A (RPA) [Maudiozyma barnettii]|uniref:Replication protein A subunit n=1 Tax=Maudiozyma barnettii TaxID=61262 RepID=A0A8H2VIC0_9SACH|nr:replication factor A subunit protein RFA1 [Kazachstania barnettii]CAB4255966.1 similar to Saccharomyces cerevisiae YAR007C RFA1 Subunit of heterotrimeric Replication Protein A (RPA) [Kazachstania barnettii]CAD1784573.1 similar to Saccharomyces cerevisiae YAR007C RFA1 Subunit of heterotrimeric Replication Protein A (RPA) [Kazachstania barnettii]
MSGFQLTERDFYKIFTDKTRFDAPNNGVYQIQNTRKTDPNSNKNAESARKHLVMLSDGSFHMKALARNAAAAKFASLELQKGDIIRVLEAEAAIVKDKKKFVLLIDDMEVVRRGVEPINGSTIFLDKYFEEHPDEYIRDFVVPVSNNSDSSNEKKLETSVTPTPVPAPVVQQATEHKFAQSTMSSSQKGKPIFAIEQLSPYQNVWTIKARVSYKGEIKTWHNQRGEGKLLNVNFLDTSGEIRATAFNDMAVKYNELLQEGKVYYVSKARLQPSKPQFTNLSHPYELSLDRESVIEPSEDEANVPKTHFDFVKLSAIENQEENATVDVLGIIQTVNPHFELTSRAGKKFDRRDIVIVDDSNYSITVGLWNQLALDFNLPEGSVVAIKGARVSDFGGKSLSMGFTSTLMPNPEVPEAYSLKGWYDATGHSGNFTSLKQEVGAGAGAGDSTKFIAQRITIQKAQNENLGRSEKGDYFNIKAAINFLKVDNFAYPACSNENCNKKVVEQSDGTWRCEKCDTNNAAPQWRYMLTISVLDETNQLWLTLFNEQAEQLLGVDANELTKLKDENPDEFTKVTQSIQMNQYDFRVRAKEDTYNDQTRIRYTAANIHKLNFKSEADYLATQLSEALHV